MVKTGSHAHGLAVAENAAFINIWNLNTQKVIWGFSNRKEERG